MNGAILCVTRNNIALTKRAIRTALEQDVPCDVVVVDNLSTDGTKEWLKTKPVATIHYPYEKSLAACWNAGIKALWTLNHDKVLVINNDVELRPDTYKLLMQMVQIGEKFVSGVSVNDPAQIGQVGDRDVVQLAKSCRSCPDFSCFMITKHVTDRVGWFDAKYFPAYCEDNDYHVRMHRVGIKAICVDLPFYHVRSQTVKNAPLGERLRINRCADNNREMFRRQYGCLPGTTEYEALFKV